MQELPVRAAKLPDERSGRERHYQDMLEVDAIIHATCSPNDPIPPELAAAGYRRWVNAAGSVRVLRDQPRLLGPWREEPVSAASEA